MEHQGEAVTETAPNREETFPEYVARLLGLLGERDPLDVLQTTAMRLADLLTQADPAEIRRPRESGWNAAQIVAHLADSEVVAAYRMRTILATPGTPIVPFDQNVWADRLEYMAVDPWDALETFAALRRDLLRLLRRVGRERWNEFGMHAERGRESIDHLTRLYAGHDLNHLAQVERLLGGDTRTHFKPAEIKPPISLETCEALDVRAGTIRAVDIVPGADRLAALTVSFGQDTRTIVAGIRTEREQPGEIVGRQALFLLNVPPRRMRGLVSEGMLFDIGYADGVRPVLACPERPVPDGTRVG
jgi:tRNA-binding protein